MSPKLKLILFALLAVCFTAKADVVTESVSIGSPAFAVADYGFGENSTNFSSQTIYTAAEMGNQAATITHIGFAVNSAAGNTTANLKIYMFEDNTQASFGNTYSIAGKTLVFNKEVTLGKDSLKNGYETIALQTPFEYSGNKNLVVAICSEKESTVKVLYRYPTTTSSSYVRNVSNSSFLNLTSPSCRPATKFTVKKFKCGATHSTFSTYSDGFGVCDLCHNKVMNEFESVEVISGKGYNIKNAGNLFWMADVINNGKERLYNDFYINTEIDLSSYVWTAIGTDDHQFSGNIYGTKTITGLKTTDYLIGTLSAGGSLNHIRLAEGKLVNKGNNGKLHHCLTLGSALINSGSCVNESSFYKSTSTTSDGGCTSTQLASGEITFALNEETFHWYQNIGTDSYPILDSTHDLVYQYTRCEVKRYTNNSALSGINYGHNLVNGKCITTSCPNPEPSSFNQNVSLSSDNAYTRSTAATVTGALNCSVDFESSEVNHWNSIFLPIAVNYNSTAATQYELAEIKGYSEGIIKIALLNIGDITVANKPYLVRPKLTNCTFTAADNILAAANVDEYYFNIGGKTLSVAGNYNESGTHDLFYTENSSLTTPTSAKYKKYFRWYGTNWNGATPSEFTPYFAEYILTDNETTNYERNEDIFVEKITYNRSTVIKDKWQAFYVPFAVTLTEEMLEKADFASFDGAETMWDGSDALVITKLEAGTVIDAKTPSLIRIKQDATPYSIVVKNTYLRYASSASKVLNTANATYTFTGVYSTFSDINNEWYAISKTDGAFHKARVNVNTKLPPYRIYLRISNNNASELRFNIIEKEEYETAISNVEAISTDNNNVYSIDGRRVNKLTPGIYVRNGKKMLVR